MTTVCGTFRADVLTGEDPMVALHLTMPDGTVLTVRMERLPAWVTDDIAIDEGEAEREERHASADRLPRSRADVLRAILDANGIDDHDSAQADAAYLGWKLGGRKGAKPSAELGGMLDAFDASKDRRKPCCLLEAFERQTRGARTWRDIKRALPALADALGVESLTLPDDVNDRHTAQDAEERGA